MNDRNEHYHDRKLELGLAETLGAERPPDLSERILAGKEDQTAAPVKREPVAWRKWLALAVAASLFLAFAGYVVSVEWAKRPGGSGDRVVAIVDKSQTSTGDEATPDEASGTLYKEMNAVLVGPRPSGDTDDSSLLAEFEAEEGVGDFITKVENHRPIQTEILQAEKEVLAPRGPRTAPMFESGPASGSDEYTTDLAGEAGEPLLRGRGSGRGAGAGGGSGLAAPAEQGREGRGDALPGYAMNAHGDRSQLGGYMGGGQAGPGQGPPGAPRPMGMSERSNAAGTDSPANENFDAPEQAEAELASRLARLDGTRESLREGAESASSSGEATRRSLEEIEEEAALMGEKLETTTSDRDKEFNRVTSLTDRVHQARTVRARLEERRLQSAVELAKRTEVMNRMGVSPAKPAPASGLIESKAAKKTWRRAVASPNATRLVIGDKDELLPAGVQANVVVDGFRARVLLDWYYFNDRDSRREGTFKLRLPNEASLYYLAFGTTSIEYRPQGAQLASRGFLSPDLLRSTGTGPEEILTARGSTWDNVKEARLVPRQKAAFAYGETVRGRIDPALAEWSGAGVFQCRVFPLEPGRLHRIVVGYDVNLTPEGDDLVYHFDVPEGLPECAVDLNVAALPGSQVEIAPDARPFTSGGRAYYHFDQPTNDKITLRMKNPGAVLLTGSDKLAGEFFATRVRPRLPVGEEQVGSSHAVFLVDTSLSSRPDKFNTYLDLMAAILNGNRDSLKQFAVVFFNIESHWWQDGYVENTPQNVTRLTEHCHTLALEGATDLKQALATAVQPVWQEDNEKKTPRPDLFLLSDGAITWGDDNLHLIGKTMAAGAAGPLFAYKTGQSGTAGRVLEHLTRETGGAVFSIAGDEEIAAAATAHARRPWVLLDVSLEGGRDLLVAGRPRSVYPDQQLTVVGRGTPAAGAQLVLKVKRGDDLQTVRVPLADTIPSELTPRAYGQVSVGQLENLLPATQETAVAYARHFRVAGHSCSLLMLDSEADYRRFQIKPEDDAVVVNSFPAAERVTRVLDETAARRTDPKLVVVDWLERLQTMQGCQVSLPTATKLAIEQMPARVFEVDVPPLVCQVRDRRELVEEYAMTLDAAQLDYDLITLETERRLLHDTKADALKAASCLVERNPGDMVLLRDVAFSSMKWGFGGQAYPLLRRVAVARPYQPQVYTAMARCLAELGQADLALVYFEVALAGRWANRYRDFGQIARMEYVRFLQRVSAGELETCVPDFAAARLTSLRGELAVKKYDLVVLMQWNTDRTDVDLHVVEPSGEVCKYDHQTTASGGRITDDVTEGFGPEMYTLANAKEGKYTVKVNYYGGDQNRTSARTKVYLSVYRYFGTPQEQVERHAVLLERTKDTQVVATVGVGR